MECMNKFESIYALLKGVYVWYICPRRKGEGGCGHSALFEISPGTKTIRKVVAGKKNKTGEIEPEKKRKGADRTLQNGFA